MKIPRAATLLAAVCLIISIAFGIRLHDLKDRHPSNETIAAMESISGNGIFRDDPGAVEAHTAWSQTRLQRQNSELRLVLGTLMPLFLGIVLLVPQFRGVPVKREIEVVDKVASISIGEIRWHLIGAAIGALMMGALYFLVR
ncbi:MAG: hypothetical protein U1G07_19800 [Verrucomicrobiota bacterium]